MALYCYLKAEPKRKTVKIKILVPFFSISLLFGGIGLILSAVLPIFSYQLESLPFRRKLIIPVTSKDYLKQSQLAGVVLGKDTQLDYTKASNWYPTLPDLPPQPSKITHYTLSVPKLEIEGAVVQIGGEDLMKSLIQYPGTALPGQYGNVVVFGHSVLPQFFNPENYKTIFSTLPKLEKGDEILVDFDGILYRYLVIEMVETDSGDISVLHQHYDSQYLSLITCVPPGTYLRRLIVKTKLVWI